jgi:hypothetical protein
MNLSRLLSAFLALSGLIIAAMQFKSEVFLQYLLINLIMLVLIWFPDEVNDYTLGLWIDGYRIENRTPNFMIAGFGWIILLLVDGSLFGVF